MSEPTDQAFGMERPFDQMRQALATGSGAFVRITPTGVLVIRWSEPDLEEPLNDDEPALTRPQLPIVYQPADPPASFDALNPQAELTQQNRGLVLREAAGPLVVQSGTPGELIAIEDHTGGALIPYDGEPWDDVDDVHILEGEFTVVDDTPLLTDGRTHLPVAVAPQPSAEDTLDVSSKTDAGWGQGWSVPPENITVTFGDVSLDRPSAAEDAGRDAADPVEGEQPSAEPNANPDDAAPPRPRRRKVPLTVIREQVAAVQDAAHRQLAAGISALGALEQLHERVVNPQPLHPRMLRQVIKPDELTSLYDDVAERVIMQSPDADRIRHARQYYAATAHQLAALKEDQPTGMIGRMMQRRALTKAADKEAQAFTYLDTVRAEATQRHQPTIEKAFREALQDRVAGVAKSTRMSVDRLDRQVGRMQRLQDRLDRAQSEGVTELELAGGAPEDVERALNSALGVEPTLSEEDPKAKEEGILSYWADEMLADRFATIPKEGTGLVESQEDRIARKMRLKQLQDDHPQLARVAQARAQGKLDRGEYNRELMIEEDREDMREARAADPSLREDRSRQRSAAPAMRR